MAFARRQSGGLNQRRPSVLRSLERHDTLGCKRLRFERRQGNRKQKNLQRTDGDRNPPKFAISGHSTLSGDQLRCGVFPIGLQSESRAPDSGE